MECFKYMLILGLAGSFLAYADDMAVCPEGQVFDKIESKCVPAPSPTPAGVDATE